VTFGINQRILDADGMARVRVSIVALTVGTPARNEEKNCCRQQQAIERRFWHPDRHMTLRLVADSKCDERLRQCR
jgi:hypothetical protein